MKVSITEKQLKSVLKRALSESEGARLINKMLSWSKDGNVETSDDKATDEPEKADTIGTDVKTYFKILSGIDEPLKQQKYGSMKWQQGVEATQMALILLGYDLPKFGVDGLFGPETAAAVNKYKKDNNLLSESVLLNEKSKVDDLNPELLNKLDLIRNEYGKSFKITSTYRDPKKNAEVGGAKNSAHLRKNAVDIVLDGRSKEDTLRFIEIASKHGIGGIGVYKPGVVHIDVESRRAWGPSHARGSVPSWAEATIKAHEKNKIGSDYASLAGSAGAVGAAGTIKSIVGKASTPSSGPTVDADEPMTTPTDNLRIDKDVTSGDYKPKSEPESEIATITPEMVQSLENDLKEKGVTSDQLADLVDPAKLTGGGSEFTDLDLMTNEGMNAYTRICDNFINTRNPGGPVTGSMLAKGAKLALTNYQKYIPPELALAQLTLEGGLSKDDGEQKGGEKENKLNRPHKTKNPFNVGNTKTKDNPFGTYQDGINAYYTLIARRYMTNNKTAADLVKDFKNVNGHEYSGDYTGDYERDLMRLVVSIRKKNENIYKDLA